MRIGDQIASMRPHGDLTDRARSQRQHEADMIAHEGLRTALARAFPGEPVISEEDAHHDHERPDAYWLIDPIDGTASWSRGFPGFVCQLARIEGDRVAFAAMHAPVLQRTWVCVADRGAYLNGDRLADLGNDPADDRIVVVDNTPEPHGIARDLMARLGSDRYLESGSIGLKAALVATGEADVFVKDVVVRDWDVAPALAIIREVGGDLRGGDGRPYRLTGDYAKPRGVLVARSRFLGDRIGAWLGERRHP